MTKLVLNNFVIVLTLACCLTGAKAASVIVKGQVEFVRTHDGTQYPSWSAPKFWFTLKGVTRAGNCPTFSSGTVLFVGHDKQELALVLAAQGGGQEIAVALDDSVFDNSYCFVSYITIGNPAPLY